MKLASASDRDTLLTWNAENCARAVTRSNDG